MSRVDHAAALTLSTQVKQHAPLAMWWASQARFGLRGEIRLPCLELPRGVLFKVCVD
jgi:hypothetical protein